MSPKHEHLQTLPITRERLDEELWEVLEFSAWAHEGQVRKIRQEPYIKHPNEVGELLAFVGASPLAIKGGYLHDTVEDTWVTFGDLEDRFGGEVAGVVWGVTKDDTITDKIEQKKAYLNRLAYEAPDESVEIAVADKISNLTEMLEDLLAAEQSGNGVHDFWAHFSAGPRDQLWWFQEVLAVARHRIPQSPMVSMLAELVDEFEQMLHRHKSIEPLLA